MNVSMHKLVPASKGAKRILDMLERGVADALERGYLRSVSFALTRAVVKDGVKDATMRETVEEYKFNVRYGSRGEVHRRRRSRRRERGAERSHGQDDAHGTIERCGLH